MRNNEQLLEKFEPAAKKLFSESFHDAKIINYEEINGDVTLLLDMSGGFTVEAVIELKFHNAKTEGTLAPYYIYDELIEMKDGFALRVLSSVGWPYEQWTIYFESVQVNYVYHPSIAIEPGEITTIEQFIDQLHEDDYFIIKNKKITSIEPSQIQQKENGIFAEDVLLGEHFEEAIRKIYCATYKDPYAHFSEPIATEELHDAVFGDDPERRVRAFNTIFALGEEVASIVNNILRLAPYDEEEMYFNIMASHFDQLNCLDKDVRKKWQ